jgi:hypothetical protein
MKKTIYRQESGMVDFLSDKFPTGRQKNEMILPRFMEKINANEFKGIDKSWHFCWL